MTNFFRTALISLASGTSGVGEFLKNMLPICQRKNILEWGNCFGIQTSLEGIDNDIMSVFQKQALARDDEVALQVGGQRINYGSLVKTIRAVERRLRKLLKPGSVALIHADGSSSLGGMYLLALRCRFTSSASIASLLDSQGSSVSGSLGRDGNVIPPRSQIETLCRINSARC